MDRAQRRQRRLDQKMWRGGGRGRGRPRLQVPEASNRESTDHPEKKCSYCGVGERSTPVMRPGPTGPNSLCNACGLQWGKQAKMGGGQNVSEEESTDDVTIYEGAVDLTRNDLQAQLHLSDARGLKWQKIAEERSEKNKELQTEIECLNLKIKEITEGKTARPGPSELKLKAEIQVLKDRNSDLVRTLDHLFKQRTSEMEILTQVLQEDRNNQASKGILYVGRNGHENIVEANVGGGDQNNGHHQANKRTGNSGRNGYESVVDEKADREHQTNGYPQLQTQIMGKCGSGNLAQAVADGGRNKNHCETGKKPGNSGNNGCDSKADVTVDIGGGQSSEEDACGKHDAPGGPEQAASHGNLRPLGTPVEDAPEALFTAMERKSALALVEQEFLMWLNSRTRRPTAKEMSFHKSQLNERPWPIGKDSYYWTGIPGSLLIDKFYDDTGMPKPTSTALTTLMRSVLRVEGSKRTNDMLWCLVWADCMNPEQLPGYALYSHEMKRVRPADPENPVKSAKARHP